MEGTRCYNPGRSAAGSLTLPDPRIRARRRTARSPAATSIEARRFPASRASTSTATCAPGGSGAGSRSRAGPGTGRCSRTALNIYTFGEDVNGELYVAHIPAGTAPNTGSIAPGRPDAAEPHRHAGGQRDRNGERLRRSRLRRRMQRRVRARPDRHAHGGSHRELPGSPGGAAPAWAPVTASSSCTAIAPSPRP